MSRLPLCLFALTALIPGALSAQAPPTTTAASELEPLRREVGALESRLAQAGSVPNSIVFFGSSSIRLWGTLDRDFPGRTVVNCGFGGSTLRDWLRYGPGIFARVQPQAIVLYCGENDLARGEAPETVFQNFQALYALLSAAYPNVPVAYLSVKPSPLRAHLKSNVERFNSLAASYLRTRKAARFLDIFNALLKPGGELDPALYRPDRLHLSASGYAVLQREVDSFLREAAPLGPAGS